MQTQTMQKLHFRVAEGINELIRNAYWFEDDKKAWAHSALDCFMGITKDQKNSILQGEMKLVPTDNGDRMKLVDEPEEFTKQFKEEIKQFTLIQQDKRYDSSKYIQPEKSMINGTGWLMQNGDFYTCEWMQHINLSGEIYRREKLIEANSDDDQYSIMVNKERWLEEEGAIKLSDGKIRFGSNSITQKQLDILSNYLDMGGKLSFLREEFIYVKQMEKRLREFVNLKRRISR